ncbi:polysaccharide deacetylase family protein [Streptomyces diacarni]|uniref:Polysaccharide deacetylase family protein n=1 Tax=Streptomyces diacarni TaxID=2800381 RepID=A0A367EU06_9ACTN|nr:polysaccharide deacetylase family protein [Streptomyces diacarni]RCG20660.1 polysaccharide deacetylase family protein [Streptomyces diacarni]
MRSDCHIFTRRGLLFTGLGVGTAALSGVAAGAFAYHDAGRKGHAVAAAKHPGDPTRPAGGGAGAGRRPVRGLPHAEHAEHAATDSYRLRPLAGETSMGAPSAHPPVRTQAEMTLPGTHGRRVLALTFDDGPHPVHTPALLEVLRRHGVQATFFVVGENAAVFPELLHDIAAEGHVVANHSYSHRQLTRLRTKDIESELSRTSELIDRVLGVPPTWCRAPYGDWHAPSLKICARLGMEPMGWSLDTRDWSRPGTTTIVRAVLDKATPGAIVLQHDGGGPREQTVQAVDRYLPVLLEQGYTCVRPEA